MFGPVLSLCSQRCLGRAPHRLPADWFCGFLIALLVCTNNSSFAAPNDQELLSTSSPALHAHLDTDPVVLEQLASDRIWLALLHQARRSIDAKTRDALHEANFFYHPDGAQRPELELDATLNAFLNPDRARAQLERCRFPARHQFLVERGVLLEPRGECPELDGWRDRIGDVELTIIFPEAFLGNPASMFGHTLLRFDPVSSAPTERTPPPDTLLGWTLDYTAEATDEVGALYMIRGLFGAYRGKFGIAPYYAKAKIYSDWQDRDIWEFPLSMPRAARERVLLHIWELRDVTLPYFFFTQNCSEKLLEVLELGWPGLGRGGGFPPAVTPVDTLRAIEAVHPGTLGHPYLRASPATKLQDALDRLTPQKTQLVEALAEGTLDPNAATLDALPTKERARVLTLAYDLLRHTFLAGLISDEDSRPRSRALLRARSQLDFPPDTSTELQYLDRVPPNKGHRTARVALAAGIQDRESFVELRVMPAYHTNLDAPGGFAEGGEIKVLDTALRYYPQLDRVRLHELVVLDITTASPWRKPFRPLSWHSEIGLRTRLVSSDRDRGLDTESVFRAQAGIGAALAPAPRLHLYTFGEIVIEAGPGLEGDAVAGPLVRAGLSWSSAQSGYTLRLEGIAGALAGKDTSAWLSLEFEQRISLSENWSMTLGGQFERAYDVGHFEARLGWIRYF